MTWASIPGHRFLQTAGGVLTGSGEEVSMESRSELSVSTGRYRLSRLVGRLKDSHKGDDYMTD